MRKGMREALLAGVAGFAIAAAATGAQAGGFALREQSAQGMGQAFAGSAAGAGGLSSMFWNPATITKFDGIQSNWSISGIIPYARITPTPTTPTAALGGTGDVAQNAVLPASYTSIQINPWLWAGLQVNTLIGLATKTPYTWSGQVYNRLSKVFSAEVTPTIGIKINDMISVGLGLRVMYFKTRLSSAAGAGPGAPGVRLEGEDLTLGFSGGVTFTPFAGTELGIGYRSKVKPHLEGTLLTPATYMAINSKISLPDQITAGLRQKVTDQFTFLAGFEWTNWSTLSSFPVIKSHAPGAGATVTTLAFQYRDGWFASIGGEYKWSPALTVRAGVGYERTPVADAVRTPRLPDNDRIWLTIGGTYNFNSKLSADFSFAHVIPKKGSINIAPGHPAFAGLPFAATVKSRLDIVAVGLNYRWDDPAVVQGNLPIVRKY